MQRVFHIRIGDLVGTAFVVSFAGENFLVTAKHMLEGRKYPDQETIHIRYQNNWKPISAKIYYHENNNIDVAVIRTEYFKDKQFAEVKYQSTGLTISQDVFMLGYPYGLSTNAYNINGGYPIPIVKKGIFSGVIESSGAAQHIIDWHNNQGFSGGPVVFRLIRDSEFSNEEYIAGVIHGYRINEMSVYNEDGSDTGLYAKENSGIGIMYEIENVIDIIKEI